MDLGSGLATIISNNSHSIKMIAHRTVASSQYWTVFCPESRKFSRHGHGLPTIAVFDGITIRPGPVNMLNYAPLLYGILRILPFNSIFSVYALIKAVTYGWLIKCLAINGLSSSIAVDYIQ
jgi:hypothetical protein